MRKEESQLFVKNTTAGSEIWNANEFPQLQSLRSYSCAVFTEISKCRWSTCSNQGRWLFSWSWSLPPQLLHVHCTAMFYLNKMNCNEDCISRTTTLVLGHFRLNRPGVMKDSRSEELVHKISPAVPSLSTVFAFCASCSIISRHSFSGCRDSRSISWTWNTMNELIWGECLWET